MPWLTDYVAKVIQDTTDPGGTGAHTFVTLPADEWWEIFSIYAYRSSGATLTISNLQINDLESGEDVDIKMPSAATGQLYDFHNRPLTVPPGYSLRVNIAAHGATDGYKVKAYYRRLKWGVLQ